MTHDVFISYSSKNKNAAQAVCHILEQNKVKCWMAPRDIPGGFLYGDLIDDAISSCKVFVLIFSEFSSASQWVQAELNIAFTEQRHIIPFRIDEAPLKGQSRLILNQAHWIDAYPDYEDKFRELVDSVLLVLGKEVRRTGLEGHRCVPIKMVKVQGGRFMMGATREQGKDASDNERPVHEVAVSDFCIAESAVTVAQYREFCEETGRKMPPEPNWGWIENHPVVNVSWNDAYAFAQWKGMRLPTEAEWEFAARGGVHTKNCKYSGGNMVDEIAWYEGNTDRSGTMPVMTKRPNELGLYDMSGNVYEWCNDWSDDYLPAFQTDPQGPEDGIIKSARGGSWHSPSKNLRVSNRDNDPPEFYCHNVGFRLASDVE